MLILLLLVLRLLCESSDALMKVCVLEFSYLRLRCWLE
jgi:hypothetical protein